MIDVSQFECHCVIPFVSPGDKLFAERYGITPEEAHAMGDAWEDVLDEVLTEGYGR